MALTIESLKGLYEKLGGTDFGDVTTIPEAIDKVSEVAEGGGGDEYETVAEIQVGEMEGQEGQYSYEAVAENVPEISEFETYYLNDESNPSTMVHVEKGSPLVGFNVQFDGEVPSRVNPDEPLVMVAWEDENGRVLVQSDTTDLSNTTVKILKKSSGDITVDDELSETSKNPVQNKVITAALEVAKPLIVTATLNTETMEISEASATLAQVLAAAASGRQIAFQLRATAENEGTTIRTFDTFTDSSIKAYSDGTGEAVFSTTSLDDGAPLLCRIVAASGDHDGNWIYDETKLATATP